MNRITALIVCLLAITLAPPAARAQASQDALVWLGQDAAYLEEQTDEDARLLLYQTPLANLTLALDAQGEALWLRADARGSLQAEQTREQAAAALLGIDESALILRIDEPEPLSEGTPAPARVYFTATRAAGWAEFDAGALRACDLTFGEFLSDGALTFAGASQTLRVLRPGAQLDGMELDEEDGRLVYEGDAYLDGQEYEFEMDARTGRLLEWERD